MNFFSLSTLSKLALALMMSSMTAQAHEVVPTIADITVQDGTAQIDMQINLDAFLAGVNLDLVEDTNDAPQAYSYDVLRASPAGDLAARAPELLTRWNAVPLISVDGTPLVLRSVEVEVPDDLPADLPRIADWTLVADAPKGASMVVSWPLGSGALVVRQQGAENPYTGLISGGTRSPDIALSGGDALTGLQSLVSYIPVGFDHILPQGLDHILFVLGLFFLSTHLRPLIWQVSAFTLAHTVTLALGALGLVTVPASIVEPLIAASIVYVAIENIFARGLTRWRPAVIFGFGLLHGLGFASVLGEFGLPEGQFVPALIGFNIGVEVGQLTVIAMAFCLIWLGVWAARRAQLTGAEEMVTEYPVMFRALSVTGSLLIAIIGVFWVIERTVL
ncbi:MAG: HupE/UreJ family protein [Sulfitobacter sp.]